MHLSGCTSQYRLNCAGVTKEPPNLSALTQEVYFSLTPCDQYRWAEGIVSLLQHSGTQAERHSSIWNTAGHFGSRRRDHRELEIPSSVLRPTVTYPTDQSSHMTLTKTPSSQKHRKAHACTVDTNSPCPTNTGHPRCSTFTSKCLLAVYFWHHQYTSNWTLVFPQNLLVSQSSLS